MTGSPLIRACAIQRRARCFTASIGRNRKFGGCGRRTAKLFLLAEFEKLILPHAE
jgi:hypothetical protein